MLWEWISLQSNSVYNFSKGILHGVSNSTIGKTYKAHEDTLLKLSIKMNITANKSLTKNALADKIFKLGFANRRGYDLLGGKQGE